MNSTINEVVSPMPTTIEDARIEQGLSQAALSAKSGVAASTISKLERGLPVSENVVRTLCDALGVQFSEVTGWTKFVPVLHRGRRQRRKQR